MRRGLTLRLAVASAVLALVVATAFVVLLSSVAELRDLQQQAGRSEQVLVLANHLEKLVVDLETGQRGFVITGQDDLLQPWQEAQAAIPGQEAELERLVADNPGRQAAARQIARAITSYVDDYAIPLVAAARQDPPAARTATVTQEGKSRTDALRAEFDRFVTAETLQARQRQDRAVAADHRATMAAGVGLAGSVLIILVFGGYLTWAIARPVRRAAAMAGRIAGGDLEARLPERGPGEVGVLQRAFNTMARSLRDSRAEVTASRARIVTAGDHARRRIERDLHDGIQQRLVTLVLDARAVEAELPAGTGEVRAQLNSMAEGLVAALDELREVSRGIHPAILSEGGLVPALKALTRRASVPASLDADLATRLPPPVEVAAYYLVSEALTNTAKHANASTVHIVAHLRDGHLRLTIHDDGDGGASATSGSGLIGLTDRVEALGGTLTIISPPGEGTTLAVELPVEPR